MPRRCEKCDCSEFFVSYRDGATFQKCLKCGEWVVVEEQEVAA